MADGSFIKVAETHCRPRNLMVTAIQMRLWKPRGVWMKSTEVLSIYEHENNQ